MSCFYFKDDILPDTFNRDLPVVHATHANRYGSLWVWEGLTDHVRRCVHQRLQTRGGKPTVMPTTVRSLLRTVDGQSDRDLTAIAGIILMITLTVAMSASIGLLVLAVG